MKTQLNDFRFLPAGFGHYQVTYTSPLSQKSWTAITSHMRIIDVIKNADDIPTQRDLTLLKKICKANQMKQLTRVINNEIFFCTRLCATKSEATFFKDQLKEKGFKIRIFKTKKEYQIFSN